MVKANHLDWKWYIEAISRSSERYESARNRAVPVAAKTTDGEFLSMRAAVNLCREGNVGADVFVSLSK